MIKRITAAALALALPSGVPLCPAATIHVPADYDSVQEAIDASSDGDEILVYPGTYSEHVIDFRGLSIVVSGLDPEDPAVVAATVIDGNHQGTVFDFHSAEDASSVLTGLTISGGVGHLRPVMVGGGITCRGNAQPTISHCLIRANSGNGYGAGILLSSTGVANLIECEIVDNDGSGIRCYRSSPRITSCLIANNESDSGGGLYCREASPIVSQCTIQDNHAEFSGGGLYLETGSAPALVDCLILFNSSDLRGGGMNCQFNSAPSLDHCDFQGNQSGELGGAVYSLFNCSPAFLHCSFTENSSGGDGGAIAALSGNALCCTACTFSGNTSVRSGAALHLAALGGEISRATIANCIMTRNHAGEKGGALHLSAATLILNSTIVDNSASESGGGIACLFDHGYIIKNSILWANTPDQFHFDEAEVAVSYCDIQAGWPGPGNLQQAPELVLFGPFESIPNPVGRWLGDTYLPPSPCVDRGDPAIEDAIHDGDPRWPRWIPNGSRSDIGAYGGPGNRTWIESILTRI
jgi:predicted outer membrane repeat protein